MKPKQANKLLLRSVIEPRQPGAIDKIAEACAAGADPNSICPDTSSSRGPVRAGSTLLTHAVQDWSTRAVAKLLECGADPNLQDELGWTPWTASTLVDESKRDQMQEILLEHGAIPEGENIRDLANAIYEGDAERAASLFGSDQDLKALLGFRVDLVRKAISDKQTAILELLFKHGLEPDSAHFSQAVRNGYMDAIELFLQHGASADEPGRGESLLMEAASQGNLVVVRRLVAAGADVNRYAWDNMEWTAAHSARRGGHTEVADWLTEQMDPELLESIRELVESRDEKYRALYEQGTASEDLSTDAIVEVLTHWDEAYGIQLSGVEGNSFTVKLSALPDNLDQFYEELQAFCPDICESKRALIRDLKSRQSLQLWWD